MNANGEVVGINSAGVQGANNIGFAIDINSVKDVIDQLKQGKDVAAVRSLPRRRHRRRCPTSTTQARQQYGVTGRQGAVITEVVTGSAADDAGLQVGDVIVKADGKAVASRPTTSARPSRPRSPATS